MKRWSLKSIVLVTVLACLAGCATGNRSINEHRQTKAIRQLGEAYLEQKDYTMALSQFLKAERLDPTDYILQQDLGLAYMAKQDLPAAVTHFKKALQIKPSYAVARNNLGVAYLAMKKWDAAIASFKMVTRDLVYATPHYPLSNIGMAYYEKKNYAEAEKYYQEALKIEPNFVNALYGLGKTYLAMGKVKTAADYFQRTVKAAPQLPEPHFDLADAYRLLGEMDKAKQEYQQVISLSPNSNLAKQSKEILSTY